MWPELLDADWSVTEKPATVVEVDDVELLELPPELPLPDEPELLFPEEPLLLLELPVHAVEYNCNCTPARL